MRAMVRRLKLLFFLACVTSVSVRFRSKERRTRVKIPGEKWRKQKSGEGWGRKEGHLNFVMNVQCRRSYHLKMTVESVLGLWSLRDHDFGDFRVMLSGEEKEISKN